ncbi:MAG: hypothetical protein WD876_03670 [Candidatus Pacearchaeota archaeon]
MGYQTDFSPKDYLSRRIIYYKKKRGKVKGLIKHKALIQKHGKIKLEAIVKARVSEIEEMIKEYEKAENKL